MARELEKAGFTELQVRMHCNGCVQRTKRALLSIDGVSDVYVDLAGQKVTVVGSADPENIMKAMKKARKKATIYSHTQATAEGGGAGTEQPAEAAAAEQTLSSDPPADPVGLAPPPDGVAKFDDLPLPPPREEPEAKPSTGAYYLEEAEIPPMAHYYPYDGVRRDRWGGYAMMMFEHPIYHPTAAQSSYPTLSYAPEYGHSQRSLLPREVGGFDEEGNYERNRRGGSDGNQITSLFSDENPNACRIV